MVAPKVYIITATIGTSFLKTCMDSVQSQTYENMVHVIVCDGTQYDKEVSRMIDQVAKIHPIEKIVLPWNTGKDGFICHKIYASIPHLLEEDSYVCFLDEDNYIEPSHISSMIETIQANHLDWCFCLRNIVGKKNNLICRDICESLGNLSPTWISKGSPQDYLIDTSCYMVPTSIVRTLSECWQRKARSVPEADRLFYYHLSKNAKNFQCTMKYTLNYRIENRSDSVKADFFMMGNGVMRRKYHDNVPWDI